MQKAFWLLAVVAFGFVIAGCGGAKTFTSPSFPEYRETHHEIAILPFNVSIDPKKLPKDYTLDMAKEAERDEGYNIQKELYTRFLLRLQKGEYSVKFQDIDKTNSLLKQAGIEFSALADLGKPDLQKILGVDAIISGHIYREKPMSSGLAVGLGVLFGVWGSTNKVNVTVNVHDGTTGDLVWKYDHEASGSVGSSAEKLAESLMKNISKKFPYKAPKA